MRDAIGFFLERLRRANGVMPGTHAIGPPLSERELAVWRAAHSDHSLPPDYLALLRRANGVRLQSDESTPCGGAFVLLALMAVQHAPRVFYGEAGDLDDEIPPSWLCISEEPDATFFVILDTERGEYLHVEPTCPAEAEPIARDLAGLLDWVTAQYVGPEPHAG